MAVVEALIASGHAEWEDETKKRCRLFWKHPGTWAAEIYEFVRPFRIRCFLQTLTMVLGDRTRDD